MLCLMPAPVETWKSYAELLSRLAPRISNVLFASADGESLWSSGPSGALRLRAAISPLLRLHGNRHGEIDGHADTPLDSEAHYGFRMRGALGDVLGLVVIAMPPDGPHLELSAVHALVKPALDCLQSELAAASPAGATPSAHSAESLEECSTVANELLSGRVAAILLPDRQLTLCSGRAGAPSGIESGVLAQMHRHLLTRAQLHGRTLVANRLSTEGLDAAMPYKALSTPIRDETRRVIGVLAVFRSGDDPDFQMLDAETLENLARKAARIAQSSFDSTTGLLTPAGFITHCAANFAVQAPGCGAHALLHVDLDQLSAINEIHGMPVGDELIQRLAVLLSRRARDGSLVARIGGDAFAMFIPECGIEPAARIAEELRSAAVGLSGSRGETPLQVSVSIGVARVGEGERRLEQAMAAAQGACRAAKEHGRNRVEAAHGREPRSAEHRRSSPGAQIEAALAADSAELLARPILPLISAPTEPRFEILLRLRGLDGSRLGLEKLVASAADEALSRRIDRWVIERTLDRLAVCRDQLLAHPARFSLPLSPPSVADPDFWRALEERVRKGRIEPGTLAFEVPEQAAAAHAGVIAPWMLRMRERGVSFTLDHLGCGTGRLSDLQSLPVSCIKIDGRLTRDFLDNPKSQSTIAAVASLARAFGLETVAAHVETDAMRARAARLGVDYGHGYFIGKSLPLDDAIRDLPLYSCFATSTGLFDPGFCKAAALGG